MATPDDQAIRTFGKVLTGCATLEAAQRTSTRDGSPEAWGVLDQAIRGEIVQEQVPGFTLIRTYILQWAQARLPKEKADSIEACLNFSP